MCSYTHTEFNIRGTNLCKLQSKPLMKRECCFRNKFALARFRNSLTEASENFSWKYDPLSLVITYTPSTVCFPWFFSLSLYHPWPVTSLRKIDQTWGQDTCGHWSSHFGFVNCVVCFKCCKMCLWFFWKTAEGPRFCKQNFIFVIIMLRIV